MNFREFKNSIIDGAHYISHNINEVFAIPSKNAHNIAELNNRLNILETVVGVVPVNTDPKFPIHKTKKDSSDTAQLAENNWIKVDKTI